MEPINRRKFLILAGASGVFWTVAACSGSSSSNGGGDSGGGGANDGSGDEGDGTDMPPQPRACDDGANTVYTNPGHAHTTIRLTGPQIQTAAAGKYTLLGGDHFHTFQLAAADFTALQAGQSINKVDLEGDGHIIKVTC